MPQSWDMGQILSLPLRRKACGGFFQMPEKSNYFSRVWTRVPEASMLTTRPPKPSIYIYSYSVKILGSMQILLVPVGAGKMANGIYNTVSELFFCLDSGCNMKVYWTRVRCDSVEWIYLIQNRVQWSAVLKTVVNLHLPWQANLFTRSVTADSPTGT